MSIEGLTDEEVATRVLKEIHGENVFNDSFDWDLTKDAIMRALRLRREADNSEGDK